MAQKHKNKLRNYKDSYNKQVNKYQVLLLSINLPVDASQERQNSPVILNLG